ncbi:hypothetical protein MNL06_05060 [Bartonella krasnovii]|nr:hypothetical protein [Bartonella krasnovii]UNF46361.1 hypothetical protein MNL06_05060 [Bartonella krasnovii]
MGLEFVGTFCAVSVCVGVDCTDFVDTSVTGFVGSGILGVDCKLGEGRVTSGCEVTVELGAVSSLEESVGKEGTPERLLDLATSVVEAVSAVGACVALVVDGCVPSFLEEASGFVIILASEESVEILGVVGCLDGWVGVEERAVPLVESVPLLKFPSLCAWEDTDPAGLDVVDSTTIGGVVIVVKPDVVGSVGALGVEGGEEG